MHGRGSIATRAVKVGEVVPVVVVGLLLVLTVGCASRPAPSGRDAGGSSAPSSTGTSQPVAATTATVLPPAPAAPTLAAVRPSRAVAPPPGTPIANIRRDCGMSAPLSDGRALWIYCDTALFGADERLQYFVNTSAAVANPTEPTVMRDDLNDTGHPRTFLRAEGAYPACTGEERASVWPQSAVTVPPGEGQPHDRVLIWFSNVCLVPGGAETFDIGLAEATYEVGPGASATPRTVKVLNPRVLPKLGKAGGYGVASVIEGPDAYLYWCGQDSDPCTIARVPISAAAESAAYRYWDGAEWVADAARARHLVMGASQPRIKASVRWVSGLDRYVMVDVDSWSILNVRVATRPEGPWTAPAWVHLNECVEPYPNNCFAAEVQPQLSGKDHIAVSYFDPTRPFGLEPTTRVVDVPVTIAP